MHDVPRQCPGDSVVLFQSDTICAFTTNLCSPISARLLPKGSPPDSENLLLSSGTLSDPTELGRHRGVALLQKCQRREMSHHLILLAKKRLPTGVRTLEPTPF